MTENYKSEQSNACATSSDFCRIFVEQMDSLFLLSLLLTADPQTAEQCFLSGLEDSVNSHYVFRERAHLWARRSIILQAIRLLCPQPDDGNELNEARFLRLNGKAAAELLGHSIFARIVGLNSFERFVFIMSILEKYSVHECSLLLGCLRQDVISARTAAIRHLAVVATATETPTERDVIALAAVSYANR